MPADVYSDSEFSGDEDEEDDEDEESDEDSVSEEEDANSFDETYSESDDEVYEECEEKKRGAARPVADSWESSDDDDYTAPPVKSKPLSPLGEVLNRVSRFLLVLVCFCFVMYFFVMQPRNMPSKHGIYNHVKKKTLQAKVTVLQLGKYFVVYCQNLFSIFGNTFLDFQSRSEYVMFIQLCHTQNVL